MEASNVPLSFAPWRRRGRRGDARCRKGLRWLREVFGGNGPWKTTFAAVASASCHRRLVTGSLNAAKVLFQRPPLQVLAHPTSASRSLRQRCLRRRRYSRGRSGAGARREPPFRLFRPPATRRRCARRGRPLPKRRIPGCVRATERSIEPPTLRSNADRQQRHRLPSAGRRGRWGGGRCGSAVSEDGGTVEDGRARVRAGSRLFGCSGPRPRAVDGRARTPAAEKADPGVRPRDRALD